MVDRLFAILTQYLSILNTGSLRRFLENILDVIEKTMAAFMVRFIFRGVLIW